MTRRTKRLPDGVLLFFVVLTALKYTFRIDAIEDVPVFSSESLYIPRGIHLPQRGIVDPADSPLYSVWYYLLSLLVPDPIRLYFVSHVLLIVCTTALLYLLLRALKTTPILAAIGSMVYLVSNAAFAGVPHNGVFVLLIMLVFLNWAMRCVLDDNAYLIAAAAALLMTFTRLEYLASLVLFLGWLAIHDLRSARPVPRAGRAARIVLVVLLSMAAVFVFGNPLGNSKSSLAFCISYFQREVVSHGLPVNGPTGLQFPWDCNVVTKAAFGDATSIPARFVSNPAAYTSFVLHNLGTYLLTSSVMPFVTPFPFLSPLAQAVLGWLELVLLLGTVLAIARTAGRTAWPALAARLPRRFLLSAAIFSSATALGAVLYYPRFYYLPLQTALLICCLVAMLSSIVKAPFFEAKQLGATAVIGLVMLVVVPNHVYGWFPPLSTNDWRPGGRWSVVRGTGADSSVDERILGRRFDGAMPTRSTVAQYWSGQEFTMGTNPIERHRPHQILANRMALESIRSLAITSPVNIWGAGNYAVFLPDNFRYVGWWVGKRDSSVSSYLQKQQVNMIVSNHIMEIYYGHVPGFQELMRNPEEYGFVRRNIPGSSESLLIERSLAQSLAAAAANHTIELANVP